MDLEPSVRAAAGGDLDAFAEIVCREILDGVHDRVPAKAFYFTGGLDAVLASAAAP